MAFLIVAGVTVKIDVGDQGARKKLERIGARRRAFSGTMHESTRAWKARYDFRTAFIPRATADTLEAALKGTPPLTCSGDFLGGSGSYHVADIGGITASRKSAATEYVVYEFALEQA